MIKTLTKSRITRVEQTTENELNKISDKLNEISELKISKNLFNKEQIINDKVISTSGSYTSVSSWEINKCTDLIPIEPNKYYIISGNSIPSGNNIRCLDETGTVVMKVLAPSTGIEYATNYQMPNTDGSGYSSTMNVQFKTPPNAAFLQFNIGAYSIDSSNTVMLELIGDTYEPDFIPSEYEEYGDKMFIKEEALPNIKEDVKKIKVLLVGSSHGMNTIAQVPWIAYHSGINIEVGNVYIGSLSLQRLFGMNERNEKCTLKYFKDGAWESHNSLSFSDVFGFTDWDFISVQRSASDDTLWITTQNEADTIQNAMTNINYNVSGSETIYMSHNEALQYVINLIRNNVKKNAEVVFNSGFADPSEGISSTQTDAIISTSKDMKEQFGIDYIPMAIAIRNARNTYLRNYGSWDNTNYQDQKHQLCYDSQHLDYGIGCYVASICFLEFIFRKVGLSVLNLNGYGTQEEVGSFISLALTDGNYTEPTEESMVAAKACAMAACNTPDAISLPLKERFRW